MEKQKEMTLGTYTFKFYTPKELYSYLDKFVIGQSEAKKVLSVAVYNHYKRFLSNIVDENGNKMYQLDDEYASELNDVTIDKSNVLMLGNTGTGKTYMVKMLAKFLNLPCYIADSTKLTESGFVGDDVESILSGLIHEANGDVILAQNGICILDEIDKLGRRGENPSITRDVGGEGVQQGLLKIVEGTKIGVTANGGRKHPEQPTIDMDTTNILFIGMGAFDGIDRIVEQRMNTSHIGFNNVVRAVVSDDEKNANMLDKVCQDDLKKFGIIPELIGRFPVITHTNPLSEDDLVRILTEPQNSIVKQYQKMLCIDGVNLSFDDEALKLIAKIANSTKTGARGIRSIMEIVLTNIMFDFGGIDEKKICVNIDVQYVENSLKNKYNLGEIKKKAA